MGLPLLKRDFFELIEEYHSVGFEVFGEESWRKFKRPMNSALFNRHRFYLVFRHILRHLTLSGAAFLDLAPYPGPFLWLLRRLGPPEGLRLYGAGLRASPAFVTYLKEECRATMFEANLDPINPDLKVRNFPSTIPLADNTVDYIHAGEIIEHLTNPSWMLQKSYRLLKSGGNMIITTPNITRIGNVFKLLVGLSNIDHFAPIGLQDPHDEWRHHFHEYGLSELKSLVSRHGFHVSYAAYYHMRITEMVVKDVKQKIIDLAKMPFYLVPHLKDGLFLIAAKP